ncbi:hypothetical protein ACFL7M_05835 [Thermodesulfobacteriota bacterium]
MNKKYRVVFLGLLKTGDFFKDGMSRLGVSHTTAEQIIKKAPVTLKEGMTLGNARRYADAVQDVGGRVNIREHGLFKDTLEEVRPLNIEPLENFTMCPQCGHKHLLTENCAKCGFIFKKT